MNASTDSTRSLSHTSASQGFTARDFDAMRRISAWISQEAILSPASTKGSTETDSSAAAEIPEKDASIHTQPSEVGAKVATTATSAGSKEAVTTPGKQEELTLSPFEPHRPAVSDEEKTGYDLGDQNVQNNRKGHWNDEKTNAEEAREDGSESHIGSSGSSHKEAEEGPGPFPALSHAAKAKAARECKRLLDRGRVWFVQEKLRLTCDLVHFVERKVTPENALLLAYRT